MDCVMSDVRPYTQKHRRRQGLPSLVRAVSSVSYRLQVDFLTPSEWVSTVRSLPFVFFFSHTAWLSIMGTEAEEKQAMLADTAGGQQPTSGAKSHFYMKLATVITILCLAIVVALSGALVVVEGISLNSALERQRNANTVVDLMKMTSAVLVEFHEMISVAASAGNPVALAAAEAETDRRWHDIHTKQPATVAAYNAVRQYRRSTNPTVLDTISIYDPFLDHLRDDAKHWADEGIFTTQRERTAVGLTCLLADHVPIIDAVVSMAQSADPPGLRKEDYILYAAAATNPISSCVDRFLSADILGDLASSRYPTLEIPTYMVDYKSDLEPIVQPDYALRAYEKRFAGMERPANAVENGLRAVAGRELAGRQEGTASFQQGAAIVLLVAVLLFIVSAVTLAAMLHLSRQLFALSDRQLEYDGFTTLEDRPRPIRRYLEILQSCALRDGDVNLGGEINGISLQPILNFVKSLRPYLSQIALGELEGVTLTGNQITAKGLLTGGGIVTAESALKELSMRELRSDLGLQIVHGTVMSLSLTPISLRSTADASMQASAGHDSVFNQTSPTAADVTHAMHFLVDLVTKEVNSSSGSIIHIGGDSLIAGWNIAGIASNSTSKAVDTALFTLDTWETYQHFQKFTNSHKLCVGISQGLLVAGNVEAMGHNQVIVAGPGLTKCTIAQRSCPVIDSQIVVDSDVADKCILALQQSAPGAQNGSSHCFREALAVQVDGEPEPLIFYAVHRFRYKTERLKAWHQIFREMLRLESTGKVEDARALLKTFRDKHEAVAASALSTSSPSKAMAQQRGKPGSNVLLPDPVLDFWLRRLEHSKGKADSVRAATAAFE